MLIFKGEGEAVQDGLSCPPPRYWRMNFFFGLSQLFKIKTLRCCISYKCNSFDYKDHFLIFQFYTLRYLSEGEAVQGGLSRPPPRYWGMKFSRLVTTV